MAKKQAESKIVPENEGKKQRENLSGLIGWFKAKKIRWIGGLLLFAVLIFLLFSILNGNSNANEEYQTAVVEQGDLIAIVGATGIVEARQTADLNWQTTGRVEHVYVQVNELVKEGEILADLADNTLPQSVILANLIW